MDMPAPDGSGGRDRLSPRNFQRLSSFIESYSGIRIPESKCVMVEGRLRRRVRATGMADLKQYCDYLFQQDGLAVEAIHLIDVVTTNKTEFFREPDHFRFLTEQAVPPLMDDGARKPLKIWSAACSTGAEPYTLAMVMADLCQRGLGPHYEIIATDISTEVLTIAQTGIYPEAMVGSVPGEFRHRYVWRSKDRSRHQVRIAPDLRATVRFGRVNLIEAPYRIEREMDVIFCRNVLIYFDRDTQQAVLRRLCDHLRPGGFLFLGHSESLTGYQLPVYPVGPTVFQKR